MRSKLLKITVKNVGCIGPESVSVKLDDVLCLVGPNNSGKTTILRAYELAVNPSLFNPTHDRCNWAPAEDPSEIQLDVHIPQGMGNVDEKWKVIEGEKRIVRSRWSWPVGGKAVRQTWDPQTGDWAEEGKAGGADNVFTSRLPKPMRIKSLDDALSTEDILLTLALSPLAKELKALETDAESQISKDKAALAATVNGLAEPHKERLGVISEQIKTGFQGVFPGLSVSLHVEMTSPELKIDALLKQGSGIRVEEPSGQSRVAQQGTGARRALFWAMLQVHNEISRQTERREALLKPLNTSLTKEKKKDPESEATKLLIQQIAALNEGGAIPEDAEDPALPGYILLMDEPENALHPMAARAAQAHLYALGQHPDWQVLITTHSPYFINPLMDHTTIARLQRSNDGKSLSPRLYVADDVEFSDVEKDNLQALQLTDVGFSEIFFGSYPILVEGDTEHAAFISAIVKAQHVLAGKVSIIRARGKAILVPLIKMLRHFKTNFGIVHDVDWPRRKDGANNAMWTVNTSIRNEIILCRQQGNTVYHRWSIPDFERYLGGAELGKDKPYAAFSRVNDDEALKEKVRSLIGSLFDGGSFDPAEHDPAADFITQVEAELIAWAKANGHEANPRLNPAAA
ncbi:AAA family ATPase [Rhizobium leguminosarum]|uniref:ATP-dependent nuclease n=1 Tax=Rhizobium leguminosarum TaxID=384 RepID=UPI001C9701CE|nr:AAA family ATPase [Rhizobium leguminosarum]MBY5413614.1 AAA family ATPase [Rhizobium leguminosarum]